MVSVPSRLPSAKKATWVTLPSLSLAVAVIAMLAGAVKLAPSAGLVSCAVGGVLGGA